MQSFYWSGVTGIRKERCLQIHTLSVAPEGNNINSVFDRKGCGLTAHVHDEPLSEAKSGLSKGFTHQKARIKGRNSFENGTRNG